MAQISDKDIADYVTQNLSNPQAIADAAKQYSVGLNDLVRATGYDTNTINNYFGNAKITPYWAQTTPVNNGIAGLPAAQTVPSFTNSVVNTTNNASNLPTITYGTTGTEGDVLTQTTTSDGTPFYLRGEEGGEYQNPNTVESYAPFTGADGKTYYNVYAPVFNSGKEWNETPITGTMTEAEYKALKGGSSAIGNMINSPVGQFALNVTGLAPFVNTYNAVKSGDVLGSVAGVAGIGGFTDVANAANLANAAQSKNPLNIALAGLSTVGVDNIGGFNTQDISKAANVVNALKTGNTTSLMNAGADYSQPNTSANSINTYPETADNLTSILAGRDGTSSITSPTDTQSLLDILGDNSNQIISDAPFVAAADTTQRKAPDYSSRSFNSAFAAARLSGEPDFTWKGNSYTTELAPSLNAGPASGRTINTGAGLNANALTNWGGNKVDVNALKTAAPYLGWNPSTYFPNIDVRMASPTGALGNVPETGYGKNQQTYLNLAPFINKSEAVSPGTTADVLSHELAHVGQVLSSKPDEDVSKLYLRMADQAGLSTTDVFNNKSDITKFNQALNAAIPYISETYGSNAGSYLGNPKAPLFEKLTDLAAIEMQTGKDLTKDPVLKETLFNDPRIIAMYNTMTIPRMSRLDPRDLPTGTVTTSDFPKGTVPFAFKLRSMLPARSKGWATPYAAGGLAGGGLTEDKAKALADAYAAGDISTVNQLLSSGISADDVKSYWGFTDADIAGLSGSGIKFTQPTTTPTDTSTNDLLDIINPPADNITSTGGITKSAVAPTSGGVSKVMEGDDIETQIAQLPQEYASWSRSADQRTMELIRKSDGAVLDRRTVGDFSDVDLAKIGLSFIPGAGPILAGLNVADAARTGNWTQAAIGATGLIPGMQNVNTALRVGQAVDNNNIFGAVTALAGNTDLQKLVGLDSANVGGFTAKDAMAAGNLVQAATTGNYGAVLTNLGTLTGSSDTTLAGRALSLYTRIQNGDTKALTEAVGLSNSIMNGSTSTGGSTTGSTTGSNITTLTDEDLAELNAGELQAYQSNGVQGLADFRRDMRLLSGLTTSGYTGDGLGGTYTGTDTTGTTTTGTTTGTTGTTTTGGSNDTVTVVGASGNDTLTGTDGTTGTTKTVNTKTCPLPNQHWDEDLKMCIDDVGTVNVTACEAGKVRNAAGNCVPINCGAGKHYDAILDTCVEDDVITPPKTLVCEDGFAPNAAGTACIPTVTVTACGPGKVRNAAGDCVPIDCGAGRHFDAILNTCVDDTAIKPTLNCAEGYKPNEAGTECIPVITIEACGEGKVRDPETGECVFPPTTTLNCQAGFKPNAAGTECIPITNDIICSDGYELDETGTKCIPKIVITACGTGKVRDPITGECVPITKDCDPGFHKDANGVCVPDTEKPCDEGYHRENGVCVQDECKEGYIRNLETGLCEKVEKECPAGQYRNAAGKCVPIVVTPPVNCQPGYEKVNGVCVPICQPGYVRIAGVCKKITTNTSVPTSALGESGEKTDPIYAGGMDDFNLLATLQELLAEEAPKKDDKKSKDKTKMATGGHLDDLLAEQMTVDDLLKLLR